MNKLINTGNRFVCMARPRRFGKSYVGDLMLAYYSRGFDNHDIFKNLKISSAPSYEQYLNKLDIIRLDIGGQYSANPDKRDCFFQYLATLVRKEMVLEFPDIIFDTEPNIARDIVNIFQKTGRQFIIYIDEYDALVRTQVPQKHFEDYLNFLNGLFKEPSSQEAIALAYLTGILPIVRDRFQSKLNNFREYTFIRPKQFTEFMGFTAEETKALCDKYAMDYNECKMWYDGYRLCKNVSIFAPLSVTMAMEYHRYDDYWSQTSIFDAILDVMKYAEPGFRDKVLALMDGQRVPVNTNNYRNTLTDFDGDDDVLTFCIHLGYLGYDSEMEECFIPNNEVRMQWAPVLCGLDGNTVLYNVLNASKRLLRATIAGDTKAVAKGLEAAHNAVCTSIGYNNEAAFLAAISFAYYYAQSAYTIFKELPIGKGFADVVFIPKYPTLNYPAFVMELKVDGTTKTAMAQIESRKYGSDMLHYAGNMMLFAINYNTETKEHTCEIKTMVVE